LSQGCILHAVYCMPRLVVETREMMHARTQAVACCMLPTEVRCLPVVWWLLHVVCCTLCAARFLLPVVCCTFSATRCLPHVASGIWHVPWCAQRTNATGLDGVTSIYAPGVGFCNAVHNCTRTWLSTSASGLGCAQPHWVCSHCRNHLRPKPPVVICLPLHLQLGSGRHEARSRVDAFVVFRRPIRRKRGSSCSCGPSFPSRSPSRSLCAHSHTPSAR
jgi:hypothetical protein